MPDDYYVSQYSGEEIDAAVGRAATGGALDKRIATFVNPNLLDGWYFGNPVDQRGGYVVPPGVAYAGASSGTTTKYYTVKTTYIYNDVKYAVFDVDGSECNVPFYTCVRGYTGTGYGIDRWIFDGENASMLIEGSGLHFVFSASATGNVSIHQRFENPGRYSGKTITYSMLGSTNHSFGMLLLVNGSIFGSINSGVVAGETLLSYTAVLPDNITSLEAYYYPKNASGTGEAYLRGCKLELGSQQTLAHQENGVWVLNEIPNYGEQLARCQRYGFPQHITYAYGYCVNDTLAYVCIANPASLRKVPVLTVNNPGALNFASQQINPQSLAVARIENNLMFIAVSASGLTPNAVCVLHDADIYISDDL